LAPKKRWAFYRKACTIGKWIVFQSFFQGELEKALKEKVIEKRNTVFEKTKEEVAKRVKFEDAVSVIV
jgi:CRISPR/Cas system-associated endoribonuclease Cas2